MFNWHKSNLQMMFLQLSDCLKFFIKLLSIHPSGLTSETLYESQEWKSEWPTKISDVIQNYDRASIKTHAIPAQLNTPLFSAQWEKRMTDKSASFETFDRGNVAVIVMVILDYVVDDSFYHFQR